MLVRSCQRRHLVTFLVWTLRAGKDFGELGKEQSGEARSFWMERIQTARTRRGVPIAGTG